LRISVFITLKKGKAAVRTKQQILVYLGISAALGILAMVLAMRWMTTQVASATMTVVVAASSISPGERVGSTNLKVVSWPVSAAVAGSVSRVEALEGRVAVSALQPGEPVLENRLAPQGSRAGLNALITPGYRAMTVKVNEVVGVAGFALPGNYVDILVTVEDGNRQRISKIVLEKILVLAVAQDHSVKDETKPRVVSAVTLEVSPAQAEQLDLARSIGSLSMVLRNQTDLSPSNSRGALIADILGNHTGQPAALPRPRPASSPAPQVEILRGIKRSKAEPA
jgi:pilus assembly protein CpaB